MVVVVVVVVDDVRKIKVVKAKKMSCFIFY